MMTLKTPIISILIGEGGSGGALGLAVADEVWMLENAVYSVISPEGCASILWKDPSRAPEAAECLQVTARQLFEKKIADKVFTEPRNRERLYALLGEKLEKALAKYSAMDPEKLTERRYQRFRRYGRTE